MCDSRCSGTVKPVFSCVRASCSSWLRVSTSSLTRVIRSSSTSTVTRMVCLAVIGSPWAAPPAWPAACGGRRLPGRRWRGGGLHGPAAVLRLAPARARGFLARGTRQRARAAARLARCGGVQRVDQFGVVAGRLATGGGQPGQDRLDPVDRHQHQADHVRRHRQDAVAHLAEHVLGGMRHVLEPRQAEEPAGALDGVHQAEDQRQRLARRPACAPASPGRRPGRTGPRWSRSENRQADRPWHSSRARHIAGGAPSWPGAGEETVNRWQGISPLRTENRCSKLPP